MRLLAGSILIVLLASAAHSQTDLWYRELPRYGQIYDPPSGFALMLGDVDRDGDLDLLVANSATVSPCRKRLYLNDDHGHFTDVTTTHLPPEPSTHGYFTAMFVDVDRDGDLDAFFPSFSALSPQDELYLNDGTGHFSDVTTTHLPIDTERDSWADVGDMNGDGWPDLVVVSMDQNFKTNHIWLNDRTGKFVRKPAAAFDQVPMRSVAVGDVDGDGDRDIAGVYLAWQLLFLNDGNANFTDATFTHLPPATGIGNGIIFLDSDKDGDLDILKSSGGQSVMSLLQNDGTGHFTDVTNTHILTSQVGPTEAARVADVNGDGWPDLILPNVTVLRVGNIEIPRILMNTGNGKFVDNRNLGDGEQGIGGVAVGDIDGDGDPDVVTGNSYYFQHYERFFFNLHHQLYAPNPAQIGKLWPLEISHVAGQQVALLGLSGGTGKVQVPPLGSFRLDLTQLVVLPAIQLGSGTRTTLNLQVPADARLVGADLYCQAAVFDLTLPDRSRFTNVIQERIQ